MSSHPIDGDDARMYLPAVGNHGLEDDGAWLLEAGRFPVGCRVLDIGCGGGAFVVRLAAAREYARSVVGVEASGVLASHAADRAELLGAAVYHADFLGWQPPDDWRP